MLNKPEHSFSFYNAGKWNGEGEDLYMFTCYGKVNSWGQSLGCHSVYASSLAGNIKALKEMGFSQN